mmetsp:Transcript_38209/g.91478  ORF Transcript_38209/g.91478 Transcript_38209/m.91478 type:complete len:283 (+) Transcript_38209:1086-1934(+)
MAMSSSHPSKSSSSFPSLPYFFKSLLTSLERSFWASLVPYVRTAVGSSLSGRSLPICARRPDRHPGRADRGSAVASQADATAETVPNGQWSSLSGPCGPDTWTAVTSTPSAVIPARSTSGTYGSGSAGSVLLSAASLAASAAASASFPLIVSARRPASLEGGGPGVPPACPMPPSVVFPGRSAPTSAATDRWCRLGPHGPPDDASRSASTVPSDAAQPGTAKAVGKSPLGSSNSPPSSPRRPGNCSPTISRHRATMTPTASSGRTVMTFLSERSRSWNATRS